MSLACIAGAAAQVAIMKEVGASKRLGHLIEGESLLNDGSAFVFFLIFFEMYTGASSRSPGEEVGYFFKLVFVAAAIGAAFGILLTILLALVYRCGRATQLQLCALRTIAPRCESATRP